MQQSQNQEKLAEDNMLRFITAHIIILYQLQAPTGATVIFKLSLIQTMPQS